MGFYNVYYLVKSAPLPRILGLTMVFLAQWIWECAGRGGCGREVHSVPLQLHRGQHQLVQADQARTQGAVHHQVRMSRPMTRLRGKFPGSYWSMDCGRFVHQLLPGKWWDKQKTRFEQMHFHNRNININIYNTK